MRDERELFTYIKDNYIPDLVKPTDKYSSFDAYSPKFNTVFELKCRRTHYPTLILEEMKYSKLANLGCNVRYVNSTPLGVFSFNLLKLKYDWVNMKMPKQTDFSNTNKVSKKIAYLNINNATKI
jgi:hypothetical protein